MRGLLLKDFYMALKYCKIFFILMLVFIGLTTMGTDNLFTMTYAVFLAGALPVTLFAYDEQQGWERYNKAFPYTKAEIVSSKYVFGLLAELIMVAVTILASLIWMVIRGTIDPEALLFTACFACTYGLIASALIFPFVFRFGAQKGRLAFIGLIVLLCSGIGAINSQKVRTGFSMLYTQGTELLIVPVLIGLAVYGLSWALSIALYRKRES